MINSARSHHVLELSVTPSYLMNDTSYGKAVAGVVERRMKRGRYWCKMLDLLGSGIWSSKSSLATIILRRQVWPQKYSPSDDFQRQLKVVVGYN